MILLYFYDLPCGGIFHIVKSFRVWSGENVNGEKEVSLEGESYCGTIHRDVNIETSANIHMICMSCMDLWRLR